MTGSNGVPRGIGIPAVILHVEDDVNDQFFVRRAFEKAAPDARLDVARDGSEAQDYLAGRGAFADRTRHPMPTLVLMDIKLPKRTGLEVLGWMRAQPTLADIPVIILSSSVEPQDLERAYELRVNAYLSKEGDPRSLLEVVRGIVAFTELANEV